jgi:hypothetical protein
VHFYPQAKGVGIARSGQVDAKSNALRIRSTRALWDPGYEDESWIEDKVMLIPRLKAWIQENNPGLGISIGEYNFGAEEHPSGGLALAEALGRFAEGGLTSAFYWDYPPANSPAFFAFRAYRNYDGKGGRFLDRFVPSTAKNPLASVFASRDATGERMVLLLLNLNPTTPFRAQLDVSACGQMKSNRAYVYSGDEKGFVEGAASAAGKAAGFLERTLEPYSMTVLELSVSPAQTPSAK